MTREDLSVEDNRSVQEFYVRAWLARRLRERIDAERKEQARVNQAHGEAMLRGKWPVQWLGLS